MMPVLAGVLGGGGSKHPMMTLWLQLNGTTVDDSGTGNTGALVNSPSYSDGGVLLNGTTQYITVADADSLEMRLVDVTLFMRFKTVGTGTYQLVTKRSTAGGSYDGYNLAIVSGKATTAFRHTATANTDIVVTGASNVNDGGWHSIGATYDRDANLTLYVDGYADGTPASIAAYSAVDLNTTNVFAVGARVPTPAPIDLFFPGTVDDVQLYKGVAFSAANMLRLHQGIFPI